MNEASDPYATSTSLAARAEDGHADSLAYDSPVQIGRYRVERILGEGSFGRVYLAHDDELHRPVAIKVPRPERVSRPEDVAAYLAEARTLAGLDHPHIVPVFDVGSTDDGLCFVVSKFIEGSDLSGVIKQGRPPFAESAGLIAAVAEALHYAHTRGLVHRDVKPANLLIDTARKPYLADFGLALREEDFGRGEGFAGTPAYMSPEQARGEGHRVDGRSDVFSLGGVLYELLTGRCPFRAETHSELLEQITAVEVRPPRQVDDTVPRELERICLKALAKRASERYTTAWDMADDLRHFLAGKDAGPHPATIDVPPVATPATPGPSATRATTAEPPTSDAEPLKIVPKGLRSFDAHDADFFLELLPGPRDRDGLPEGVRFWKNRIEEADPDKTFSVGLLYGPSGCGKSSLVKAGLLPRLAGTVTAVYVEATPDDTEARLLKGLRKHCPDLPDKLSLVETLAALRRGRYLPAGKKVLLVLDQFEQWLHARRGEGDAELVQALRHCDGGRVQCLVLVRDDFWLAVSRFMGDMEIELVQGHNMALVDLFDPRHARKVLAAFGRAFGALPESLSKDQNAFLDRAIAGLAQDGKVISVRLALFAEMMKGKPWSSATLKEVGGTEGVGVTFLEETFAASTAPPQHRLHRRAAQAVLKALLPETGTDIKGGMRSHEELRTASGYAHRPGDFEQLLRILDGELRLVTPTDPEGVESEGTAGEKADGRYYQMTHDYLVPSLREWLARKQKETRRGRAELLLADRAAVWNARSESRQLPSLLQWFQIRWLTQKKSWTPPQRKMMRQAGRYHALRGVILAVLLGAVTLAGLAVRDEVSAQNKATHAAALVKRLPDADIAQVHGAIAEIEGYRAWADPLLRERYEAAQDGSRAKLYTGLALLPVDDGQVDYLYRQLLEAGPAELPVIRDALRGHRAALVGRLWGVLEDGQAEAGRRFRAACALAGYDVTEGDANRRRWQAVLPFVADRLLAAVQQNPSHFPPLLRTLEPVRDRLLGPLAEVFRSEGRPEADRSWATSVLAEYAADRPDMDVLADLLQDAGEKQFAVLYPRVEVHRGRAAAVLSKTVTAALDGKKTDAEKETLARRQANAAVALLKLGQPEQVWPLLKHSPDPRARSYLIHRLSALGADPRAVGKRWDEEEDVSARRALLLCLGAFTAEQLPAAGREPLLGKVWRVYREEADAGLHGAAEWLLRQWGQQDRLKEAEQGWAKDGPQREERLARIRKELARDRGEARPQWYVNGQGQTLVVIPGPVEEFLMGSPATEDGREGGPEGKMEARHRRRIGRSFAIAAKEVTVAQFRRFRAGHDNHKGYSPTGDHPVNTVTWYDAAAYCNWLSKEEGIAEEQWCYVPNKNGEYAEGMRVRPNYLSLEGYRLPSEAEWEYACRAGAVTSRYHGEAEGLLGKYGWYTKVSQDRGMLPGGSLKPNDLGLFDMLGNALEWCQEEVRYYPAGVGDRAIEDKEDKQDIKDTRSRVLRGGSFLNRPMVVRSADRFGSVPSTRVVDVGFRPARTFR